MEKARKLLPPKSTASRFGSQEQLRRLHGRWRSLCNIQRGIYEKGQLGEDEILKRTLREFVRSSFVPEYELFVIILEICYLSDPFMTWSEHGTDFVSDICNRHRGAQSILGDDCVAKRNIILKIKDRLTRLKQRLLEITWTTITYIRFSSIEYTT